MDLAKYRALFLEEATEHLEEMSRALLALEKQPADGEAIDAVFRMAHSIKGMAASLGYDAVTELSHRLEDRMEGYRSQGVVDPEGVGLLFTGLEGLERLVAAVREHGEPPGDDPAIAALQAPAPSQDDGDAPERLKKKA